jgi:peroxiredoxin
MTAVVRALRSTLVALVMLALTAPWSALAAPADLGEAAPNFTIQTIDGTAFRLADHQGRVVVLMFTAPGCGECIPELIALSQIHAEYAARGVDILAVNVDPYMTADDVADFKNAIGDADYAWAQDESGTVTRAYGVRALETTVVIDRSGRVAYRDERTTMADDYRALLAPLL